MLIISRLGGGIRSLVEGMFPLATFPTFHLIPLTLEQKKNTHLGDRCFSLSGDKEPIPNF
jgi:hypothetical protein